MRNEQLRTISYQTGGKGWRAALCIVLGVGILALSLQLQAHWRMPAFSLKTQATAALPTESIRKTRELSLSEHGWYALQLGAFTQESAARQLAQEYIARGAAGFVCYDGSAYRVLAAAYATRAEAQSVQQRLSVQGVNTYIHPHTQNSVTLRAGGTQAQLDALGETLAYLDSLDTKLSALSLGLDAQTLTPQEAQAALLSECATCTSLQQALSKAFDHQVPQTLQGLCTLLQTIAETGENAQENSAARVGAALKCCQLTAFYGLCDFCQGL